MAVCSFSGRSRSGCSTREPSQSTLTAASLWWRSCLKGRRRGISDPRSIADVGTPSPSAHRPESGQGAAFRREPSRATCAGTTVPHIAAAPSRNVACLAERQCAAVAIAVRTPTYTIAAAGSQPVERGSLIRQHWTLPQGFGQKLMTGSRGSPATQRGDTCCRGNLGPSAALLHRRDGGEGAAWSALAHSHGQIR